MLAFVTKSSKTRKEDIFSLPLFEIQKNVIAFLTQHVIPLYVYETFICMHQAIVSWIVKQHTASRHIIMLMRAEKRRCVIIKHVHAIYRDALFQRAF